MKNSKQWKEEGIFGNRQEAIEQAIEALKDAYRQSEIGGVNNVRDNIECALNRLGVVELTAEEIAERKKSEYVKMSF
jgi:hypothetical protein